MMCEKEFQIEIIEAGKTQKVRQSVRTSGRFVNGGDFEYDPAITETTRQTMFCYTYQFLKPEECVIEYQGHTYRMPEKFTIDIYESAKRKLNKEYLPSDQKKVLEGEKGHKFGLKLQYDPAEIKEIPEKKQIVLRVTVLAWDVQTDIVMEQIA